MELGGGALLRDRGDRQDAALLVEGEVVDASSAPPPKTPEPAPRPSSAFGVSQCKVAGVKLSKDGRCVFTYDPGRVRRGSTSCASSYSRLESSVALGTCRRPSYIELRR